MPRTDGSPDGRIAWSQSLWTWLLLWLLAPMTMGATTAQADEPTVIITWPNEGETLYAGPSSLLYSIPIDGWVRSASVEDGQIRVRLDLVQGDASVGSLEQTVAADGSFSFLATVNPAGSEGRFPAEHLTCGYDCHVGGAITLPAGALTLQITALDRNGRPLAVAERHIVVDRSADAEVPVRVVQAGAPQATVAGVRVTSDSWLYMWRARHEVGLSGEDGMAHMFVETLAEAPTEVVFRVLPTIVDGVLYQGEEAVSLTLPPGARSGGPLELTVTAQSGAINGSVEAPGTALPQDLAVQILRIPAGELLASVVAQQGFFAVSPLPMDRYIVRIDPDSARAGGLYSHAEQVDLTALHQADVGLTLYEAQGATVRGIVQDASTGRRLPFAWVQEEEGGQFVAADPAAGSYLLSRVSGEHASLIASAPGYYSRAQPVDLAEGDASIPFQLAPQPETQFLTWGAGTVVIPSDGVVETVGDVLRLDRGWLWGYDGDLPLTLQVGETRLTVEEGQFAVEVIPGRRAWLTIGDGRATLERPGMTGPITVHGGQMVNLLNSAGIEPVALDADILEAVTPTIATPLTPAWEPTLGARLRDGLARIGIGAAQVVTFIIYGAVIVFVGGGPLVLLWRWRRQAGIGNAGD